MSVTPLFDRAGYKRILLPLIVEQLIAIFVTFVDAVMISGVGEAALAGVSLADLLNVVLMQLFTAIGAGGAIVAAQYLGKEDRARACATANQMALLVIAVALTTAIGAIAFSRSLLRIFFPALAGQQLLFARQYLVLVALSYPFFGLYSGGTGLLYAQGNTRPGMMIALVVNAIKIGANFLLIRGLGLQVIGAGIATLLARLTGAVLATHLLLHRGAPVHYAWPPKWCLDGDLIRRIVRVSIPAGMDNTMFLFGKLIVGIYIATLTQAQIAANAASNTIGGFVNIPSNAINIAAITIVGQCIGASRPDQARANAKRLLQLSYLVDFVMGVALFFFARQLIAIMRLKPEAAAATYRILRIYAWVNMAFQPPALGLPSSLRAAGDGRFAMYVSIGVIFLVRVVLSYLFVMVWNMGVDGIWYAMYADWVARAILFVWRFRGNQWLQKKLV